MRAIHKQEILGRNVIEIKLTPLAIDLAHDVEVIAGLICSVALLSGRLYSPSSPSDALEGRLRCRFSHRVTD